MMIRRVPVMLAALLALLFIPVFASAETEWTFDRQTAVMAVTGTGDMEDYPTVIFHLAEEVRYVVVGEEISSVGRAAFGGCLNLKAVALPESVTKIGISAFNFCSSLRALDLPQAITEIPACAFYQCRALTALRLPEGVASIGLDAFYRCEAMKAIYIPAACESIDPTAFQKCAELVIYAPEGSYALRYADERGIRSVAVTEETDLDALFPKSEVSIPVVEPAESEEEPLLPDSPDYVLYIGVVLAVLTFIAFAIVFAVRPARRDPQKTPGEETEER